MAEGGIKEGCGPDSQIISGVIEGVRQSFIDSGLDLEVLAKLEQLWVTKLSNSSSSGLAIADVMTPMPVKNRRARGQGRVKKEAESAEIAIMENSDEENDETETIVPGHSGLVSASSSRQKVKTKKHKKQKITQVDGPADSSDEEDGADDDDDGDDDDDDDDDDIDPDGDDDDEGVEEEPLASEDDISDEDASDLFETDNVVVCQYDKITRAKNKWKFHLKDGIMNLNGKDYVFQKAHGDAEW